MKISVIIPVYNASLYLERCVKSLLAQTYNNIELIFVDDKSTDDSLAILRRLIDSSDTGFQVKILTNDTNRGCGFTRRRGMKEATGDYMIHVDCDDYVNSEFIESLMVMARFTQAEIVYCNMFYDYGDRIIPDPLDFEPNDDYPWTTQALCAVLIGEFHGSLCNKLIKRSLIEEHDIYPPDDITLGEDKLVTVQALYFAHGLCFSQGARYYYNKANSLSITSQSKAEASRHYIALSRRIDAFFEDKQHYGYVRAHHALVLGHVLLYGSHEELTSNKDLWDKVNFWHISDHPTAPIYYKIAALSYRYGLGLVAKLLHIAMLKGRS